jgi:gamma-glutamyl-gamma-aminobutyrate hydrolase PuuD
MKKPRVLVPTRRHRRKAWQVQYVGELHLELLLEQGALPIVVPAMSAALDLLPAWVDTADALLLPEGEDLDPRLYDPPAEASGWIEAIDANKDAVENALADAAFERGWPILGICRGAHLMNVNRGGSLWTDIRQHFGSELPHVDWQNYDEHRHRVHTVPGTLLAEIYGEQPFDVPSQHHQAVARLADVFRVSALADDGAVEGFYAPDAAFVAAVQYHPERALGEHPGHRRLIERFVASIER